MSAEGDHKFFGWVAKDKNSIGNLVWEEYTPKTWEEDDVEIKISHCGICASDLHTLRSGWGPTNYPAVVGHEIVGKIIRVGKNVKDLKVGDRVGVGAQSGSCKNCAQCKEGEEPYCEGGMIGTYNGVYPNKSKSYGGYAEYSRLPAQLVFKIPDNIPSAIVAPMMCGGVTVYSPLKYNGAGPGKKVGIIGIGGLGHFGILFAKALGCEEILAISRSESKKKDALEIGATKYLAMENKDDVKANGRSLDLIICTANSADMPLNDYLSLLKHNGKLIFVGVPEEPFKEFGVGPLIFGRKYMGGSLIGGTKDINDMLELASKQNIKSWVNERPMKEANQAVQDMEDNKARYRFVLVNPE